MKKKILIGSIFAALLILSMPAISNVPAQQKQITPDDEDPPSRFECFLTLGMITFMKSVILSFEILFGSLPEATEDLNRYIGMFNRECADCYDCFEEQKLL